MLNKTLRTGELAVLDFSEENEIKMFCLKSGVKHLPFFSWKKAEEEISKADLLISYKLHKIIPSSVLGKIHFAAINIHPSMLPKYPGLNPWFQMYYNMDLQGGVTIHRITQKPDCGHIISQKSFQIEAGEPLPAAKRKADEIASELLVSIIEKKQYLNTEFGQTTLDIIHDKCTDLSSLKYLPAKRLWHILRGFPSLIPELYPDLPHRFYEAGGYIQDSLQTRKPCIVNKENKAMIQCKDGYISLDDFSLFPTAADYIHAVKSGDFINRNLQNMVFEKTLRGSHHYIQGREAVTFIARTKGAKVGVRLTRNIQSKDSAAYSSKLSTVNKYLKQTNVNWFADYIVISEAIRTLKGVFPAIIMKWYTGKSLMSYIRHNLHSPSVLSDLLRELKTLFLKNHKHGIVHGDIHSNNISISSTGQITFLDIDSIWIYSLGEVRDKGGNRNYQHPLRINNKYCFHSLDYFSEIIILSIIYTARYAPDIFEQFADDEGLFKEGDYLSPEKSQLFETIGKRKTLTNLKDFILKAIQVPDLKSIPSIETFEYDSHKDKIL